MYCMRTTVGCVLLSAVLIVGCSKTTDSSQVALPAIPTVKLPKAKFVAPKRYEVVETPSKSVAVKSGVKIEFVGELIRAGKKEETAAPIIIKIKSGGKIMNERLARSTVKDDVMRYSSVCVAPKKPGVYRVHAIQLGVEVSSLEIRVQ